MRVHESSDVLQQCGCRVTKCGLELPSNLSLETWGMVGRVLGRGGCPRSEDRSTDGADVRCVATDGVPYSGWRSARLSGADRLSFPSAARPYRMPVSRHVVPTTCATRRCA